MGICKFMIPFLTYMPMEVYFSPAYRAISSVVFEHSSPPFDAVTPYVNPSNSSHLPLNAISLGAVVCVWGFSWICLTHVVVFDISVYFCVKYPIVCFLTGCHFTPFRWWCSGDK